ncbi:MAG: hypothetical protein AMJ81_00805 [Phycisphaerae bacterium SM23_33]|nr:MAG: hypothetical protein AMJ81_00805 [Phycisphaerae bacterium SM23_33]
MSVQVIEGFENLPASARGCVLAVGNFDGFHLGHREILRTARRLADGAGAPLVVVAFDPPPAALLAPDRPVQVLLPKEVKYRLLGQHGADAVVVIATTREFLHSSPEAFVRDVLVGRFAARHVVEGENFFFGRDRAGDIQTLRRMAKEGGFEVTAVPPVSLKLAGRGRVQVSSSLVRELVLSGDVAAAGRCLGRPYALHGRVVGGERRGRLLTFPTANVEPAGVIAPADGVYAARAELGGKTYPSAVSIGDKPTFGPAQRCIEANLIDAAGDFYDQPITLVFLRRLRDQIRFPDAESLRAQIAKDVERVRELCR